jgi:sarcosine oxidase subunit beta
MPKLSNIRVRRTWRGLYPMTPDGFPIIGRSKGLKGYIFAVGMCGQGFMLGPGVGLLLSRMVQDELTAEDQETLEELNPDREFGGEEKLK